VRVQVSRFVRLDIDPKNVMWRRVVDINDRYAGNMDSSNASLVSMCVRLCRGWLADQQCAVLSLVSCARHRWGHGRTLC
jgi:formyltetrahydrofolate synthetase